VRLAFVLLAVTGCRIGFDPLSQADDGDAGAPGDAGPAPELACGDTLTTTAAPISANALEAVVTSRGLAALWLGPGGALLGTTWRAVTGDGVEVVEDAVPIAQGAFTRLWAAASGDEIFVVTWDSSALVGRLLRGDLTPLAAPAGNPIALGSAPFGGRDPITRKRGAPGFVVITSAGEQPGLFEVPPPTPGIGYLINELRFHGAPSIAADGDGYAFVTELADGFGPGCWSSKLDDDFQFRSGPASLESTQQADCDSSTVAPSDGPAGAGMAWMDRDPVNSYVEFRGTVRGSGAASLPGETGVGLPAITGTSTGFAVLYRSAAGVRVFDAAGARTLAPASALADLVTWADRAIVVWAVPGGAPRLTRLCPSAALRSATP
jgi:hypothetical protein